MEWEQRTEDTETDEEQWEEHVLYALRDSVSTIGMVSDIQDFEGLSTTIEVDTQDTDVSAENHPSTSRSTSSQDTPSHHYPIHQSRGT